MTVFEVRVIRRFVCLSLGVRRFVCLSLGGKVTELDLESSKGWDGVRWYGSILKESNKVDEGEGGESIVERRLLRGESERVEARGTK